MRKTLILAALAMAGFTTASAHAGFAVFRTTLSPGSSISYSFTDNDGIGITATAESNNPAFTPLVTRDNLGLGINSGSGTGLYAHDGEPTEVNHSYFAETLWLSFDQSVLLNRLVLKNVGFTNYAGKYVGSEGYRLIDGNGLELASGIIAPDSNTGNASIYLNQLGPLTTFGIQATNQTINGSKVYGSFAVNSLSTTAAPLAVPLPAAAWSGLGMLGLLGAGTLRKKGMALLKA